MEIAYYHLPVIDSTNNFAKSNLSCFDKAAMTVVYADIQTQGRGRFQRKWISAPGNLCATIVLFTEQFPFLLTQRMALSVDHVLRDFLVDSSIKWPNDFVVRGKKIGGILTEKSDDAVVIGVGLNLSLTEDEIKDIPQAASSVFLEIGKHIEPRDILKKMVHLFIQNLEIDSAEIAKLWVDKVSWMIGGSYIVKGVGEPISGYIKDISPQGAILFVSEHEGAEQWIYTADVQTA